MTEGAIGLGGPCTQCGTNVIDDFRRVKSDFVCPHCGKQSRFKKIEKYVFTNGTWSPDARPDQSIFLPTIAYAPSHQLRYGGSSLIVGSGRDDYEHIRHIRHTNQAPLQHARQAAQRAMDVLRSAKSVDDLFQTYDFHALRAAEIWDRFRQEWAKAAVIILSRALDEDEAFFFHQAGTLLAAGYGKADWQHLIVHALPAIAKIPPALGGPLLSLHRHTLLEASSESGQAYLQAIEDLLRLACTDKRLLVQSVDAAAIDGLLFPSVAIACVERLAPGEDVARTWIRSAYSNRDWKYEQNLPKVRAIGVTENEVCRQFISKDLDAEEKFQRITDYVQVWKYIPESLTAFLADCIHVDRWSEGGLVAARCYSTLDLLDSYDIELPSPLLAEALFHATAFHFCDGSETKPVLDHALKILTGKYEAYLPLLVEQAIGATIQSQEEASARLTALSFPLALIAAGVASYTASSLLEILAIDKDPDVRFAILSVADKLSLSFDTVARAVASALTMCELDMLIACRRFLATRQDIAACSIRHVIDLSNHATEAVRAVGYELLGDIGGEQATDQLRTKLANWVEGPAVVGALQRTGWTSRLPEDQIHVAMARRDGARLRTDPQAIEVISRDLLANDSIVVNNAVFTCIGLGNEHYLSRIVAVLHQSDSKTMAESFMNCGYKPLATEGEKWAAIRGYAVVKSGEGAHPVRWNSF